MKHLAIAIAVSIYVMALTSLMAYSFSPLPVSSEPTRPPLEVSTEGRGETYNPQLTVDGKELQGSEL